MDFPGYLESQFSRVLGSEPEIGIRLSLRKHTIELVRAVLFYIIISRST
jgi:hypothetical protein